MVPGASIGYGSAEDHYRLSTLMQQAPTRVSRNQTWLIRLNWQGFTGAKNFILIHHGRVWFFKSLKEATSSPSARTQSWSLTKELIRQPGAILLRPLI
jgi:hypothetical protein